MQKTSYHPLIAIVMLFSLAMVCFSSYVFAQNTQQESQVKIKIIKTENGETEIINKYFSPEDKAEMEEMLKEFDVDYDAGGIGEDEEVEIIIRKKKKGEFDKDVIIDIEKSESFDPESAPKKNFLGVYFEQPSDEKVKDKKLPHNEGVIITGIVEGSAAEKAGLQEGDFITHLGGKKTANKEDFIEAIRTSEPGKKTTITFYRDAKEHEIAAHMGFVLMSEMRQHHYKQEGHFPPGKNCHGSEYKRKPFLGVILDEQGETNKGIVVKKVVAGSTAEDLGLQEGDVIKQVNNKRVNHVEDLKEALRSMQIGEAVKVEFSRDEKVMKKEAAIKSRGEANDFRFQLDEEKMIHCFEKMAEHLEKDIEINKEELKENLEKTIERLEFKLEQMKDKLEEIDIDKSGLNDPDLIKEISVNILIEDVTKDEAESLKQSGITADNNLQTEELSFSPNPNDGRFNLSFNLPEKGKTTVKILDINNKEIYSENLNRFSGQYDKQIDVSNNPKGVYFLQVTQNGKSLNKKIIVQ